MALATSACGSSSPGSTGTAASGAPAASSAAPTEHAGHTAKAPAALPLRAGERFLNLTMPQPYTPSAPNGGTDEYRCLLIDPHLTKPAFLTGTRFQPQNGPIVHHAVVFAVLPENAANARAKDAETPGQGWTCFGDDDIEGEEDSAWVDTWTPGGTETVLKEDVGFPLAPGSLIVLQVHYNLLATDGRSGESDQSRVRLRLTAGTAATQPLTTVSIPGPIELPCASGESGPLCDRAASVADVTKRFGADVGEMEADLVEECNQGQPVPGSSQRCDVPVPRTMTVYAALGHMHLLGRSIKVELNPGTAKARTLIDVPAFNFDDQRYQQFSAPVEVKEGDMVRITCTHDATLRRKLPQLSKLPPRYVVWGDGTSDEMCLGLLIAAVPA